MRTSQKHPPIIGRVCGRLQEVVNFKNRSTGGPFLVTRLQGVKTTENHKTASPTTFRETTLQLCSESISLSAAKLRIAKRPYSGGALILPRSLHQCSVLWVFKATLSFTEKGQVKTGTWGHTWGSKTRNLLQTRPLIRKNDTDRDGVSFSIFLQWSIYLINSVDKTKSLSKKKTQKRQPSIDPMQIFLGVTGSLPKWTVSPKEFNRIRFLIYYIVNMCP